MVDAVAAQLFAIIAIGVTVTALGRFLLSNGDFITGCCYITITVAGKPCEILLT